MKLSPYIQSVQFPPITEVKSWLDGLSISAERPLVDLCQAVPDYAPAPQLIEYLHLLLDDPVTSRYSPDEGLLEARTALSAWYARRYGNGPEEREICLTIGASQAFWLAILTICQAGDEVIVQLPAYFDHPMALQALGVDCIWAPFDEASAGQPDVAAIAERITPRTRAILIVSPSNPTGAVTSPETLRQLYNLARQHDIALVLDETYNAFLPPATRPHTLFNKPDWQKHFIHIASFGKTFALTGYRAGALVAGPEVILQALKIQDTMAVCQPRITQQAIRFGCEHLDSWVVANAIMMQQRHDCFRSLFVQPCNRFQLVASGGFFAWVRHPWPGLTGRAAARRMVEHANLLCLPGEAFGPGLEGFLRLAFGNIHENDIPAAVQRFLEIGEQFK
jgi:aspartate/methionine/tyrosine aminotransferase